MENDLETKTIHEIVSIYANDAAAHRDAIIHGDSDAANAAYDRVWRCSKELKKRGPNAQMALLPLLNDNNPDVRLCAATDALAFAPELGFAELERLANSNFICGSKAQIILREWRRGKLKFL